MREVGLVVNTEDKYKVMPYNQYQDFGNGISHIGNVTQQIALGLAQQKAAQAQMQAQMRLKQQELMMQNALNQQRMQLMQQQGRQAESVQGLNDARAGSVQQQDKSKGMLQDALWQAGMVQAGQNQGVDMGPRGDIAIARAMQAMGGLPAAAFHPQNMAQMLQMGDPRAQQLMATGTKATATVSPGASLVDQYSGVPLYQSPRALSPGQVLTGNEVGAQGNDKVFAPMDLQRVLATLNGSMKPYIDPIDGTPINPNDPTYKMLQQSIQSLIPQMMNRATNAPANPRVGLQGAAPQIQNPTPQMVSPRDKASLANQISQQNPTWTREQVIQAVKQQLGE
jgi:hypothetical protein